MPGVLQVLILRVVDEHLEGTLICDCFCDLEKLLKLWCALELVRWVLLYLGDVTFLCLYICSWRHIIGMNFVSIFFFSLKMFFLMCFLFIFFEETKPSILLMMVKYPILGVGLSPSSGSLTDGSEWWKHLRSELCLIMLLRGILCLKHGTPLWVKLDK